MYSHSYCIVFAYLVGCRMTPTHIINTTLVCDNLFMSTVNCNAYPIHRGHYRHRNPSHVISMNVKINGNIKLICFNWIRVFYIFLSFTTFLKVFVILF